MFTSVLLLALTGMSPLNNNSEPVWLNDYSLACKQCEKSGKPLALFVGSGLAGWNQLSREGQLSQESGEILTKKYVCLYLDTNQKAGSDLAIALEMPNQLGIVISDSTGRYQAFRHEGNLKATDLNRYLKRYSDPQRVVITTESNPGDAETVQNPQGDRNVVPASYSSFSRGRSC
jgi:hypothetical protein